MMEHIVPGILHAAAVGSVAAGDLSKDVCRKRSGAAVVVVGLHTVGGTAWGGIEMDAYEGGLRMGVGDPGAATQRDKNIGGAGHHDPVTTRFQQGLHPAGNIEGQHLFGESLRRLGPVVIPSVSGIEHHGAEVGKSGPLLKDGATRQ